MAVHFFYEEIRSESVPEAVGAECRHVHRYYYDDISDEVMIQIISIVGRQGPEISRGRASGTLSRAGIHSTARMRASNLAERLAGLPILGRTLSVNQIIRAVHQADMRKCLRKASDKPTSVRIVLLCQQPDVVAQC